MSKVLPIQKYMPVRKNDPRSPDFKQVQEMKLRKAAQMYEQKFLNTMMAQMRKTVPKSELMKQSFAEKIYQQKLDDKYVDTWTKKGGIGLADMIYDQLHAKIFPKQVGRPNGPLPVQQQQKSYAVPQEKASDGSFHVIQPQQEPQGKADGAQFYFKRNSDAVPSGEATPVQAPWNGTITDVVPAGEQPGLLRIQHDNGLESTLAFKGELASATKPGGEIVSGQRLGSLQPLADGVFWRVRLKS